MAGKTKGRGVPICRTQMCTMPTGKRARGHTWQWSVLSLGGFNYVCILPCIDNILYHMIKFPNGSVTSDSKSWTWWPPPCLHSPTYFIHILISVAMAFLMGHLDRRTGFQTLGPPRVHIQAVSDVFCEFRMISSNKGLPLTIATYLSLVHLFWWKFFRLPKQNGFL